jgi:hypothetical protein
MPLLSSRHLVVAVGDDGISVSYQPPVSLTLGSESRSREVRYRVKAKLKRAAPLSRNDDGETVRARFELSSAQQLKSVVAEIDRLLDGFPKQRLTPRMVEEILEISAAERRRWNKDGRLPKSGAGSFRRGKQSISFNLHPPEKIAQLAKDQTLIAQWRQDDAALIDQRKLAHAEPEAGADSRSPPANDGKKARSSPARKC